VEVRLDSAVSHVDDDGVVAGGERIEAHTVIWAAGVRASPLVRCLGAPLDRTGRIQVEEDLSVPGAPEVFVVGDTAAVRATDGGTVPGVAPAAIQAGRHAAANILASVRGKQRRPFVYRDKGALATIGRSAAVAHTGRWKFSGFWAWLAWLLVHVLFLITFRNRFAVLFEWAWAYFTYQRTARVVVEGAKALPEPVEERLERAG
jgi:NADH dehydrogenase